jgi:tRNA pseudouridine synthase 10
LVAHRKCFICHGITLRIAPLGRKVIHAISKQQWSTFSVGIIVPAEIQEREDQLRSELKIRGRETLKSQFSRIISEAVRTQTHKKVNRFRPDITVLVNIDASAVELQARPLFVYGRYSKPRNVPQRMYFCPSCGGRGCHQCAGTGYLQTPSVESIVGSRFCKLMGAGRAKFTWFGSEDPDSQVLPPGRPFVLELKNPRRRIPPRRLNLVTGRGILRLSGLRALVDRPVKFPSFVFKTKVRMKASAKVAKDELTELRKMNGATVRFDSGRGRIVHKKVYSIKARTRGMTVISEIKMDGGLPVKRLVSGEGVSPSISELLKTPLKCEGFDILRVWERGEFQFG